jgi:hypothetical protein
MVGVQEQASLGSPNFPQKQGFIAATSINEAG